MSVALDEKYRKTSFWDGITEFPTTVLTVSGSMGLFSVLLPAEHPNRTIYYQVFARE